MHLKQSAVEVGKGEEDPVLFVYAQEGDVISDEVGGGGGGQGIGEGVFRMQDPLEMIVQFSCNERGRWGVGRAGIVTLPTEIALNNSGPCCGELLTCLLTQRFFPNHRADKVPPPKKKRRRQPQPFLFRHDIWMTYAAYDMYA